MPEDWHTARSGSTHDSDKQIATEDAAALEVAACVGRQEFVDFLLLTPLALSDSHISHKH